MGGLFGGGIVCVRSDGRNTVMDCSSSPCGAIWIAQGIHLRRFAQLFLLPKAHRWPAQFRPNLECRCRLDACPNSLPVIARVLMQSLAGFCSTVLTYSGTNCT